MQAHRTIRHTPSHSSRFLYRAAWTCGLAAGILTSSLCTIAAAQQAITFSAIGDVPYDDSELPILQQHVTNHNRYSPSEFMVHVGDIFSGGTPCDEYRYSQVADVLKQLAVPAWMCPGDNETTDCADQATGWLYWTRYFQYLEENFCGTPAHEHQTVRPENFAFVSKGVLFVGLNLVGGSVDDAIQQDDADWVTAQLQLKASQVRSAVIFAQAGPNGRDLFFSQFEPAAAAFAKPILFIHGDGHSWKDDYPFSTAPKVRRIQVERGTNSDPPIQVTATVDTLNPFVIVRNPWPSGTPVLNRPPCANAGPDRAISIAEQAWLRGMASDDGDPSGFFTVTWSKTSGPGTVTFTRTDTVVTYASFSATGTYTLRLRASDGALTTDDYVTVTVSSGPATNEPPVAVGNSYQVFVGNTLTVSAPGVLGNDYDPDGDRLTAVLGSGVAHGTLALNSSGGFTYTPTPDWYGIDAFAYRAFDGALLSNTATVTITVKPLVLTLGPTGDAPVNSAFPTTSYGAAKELRVEQDVTSYRSFIKFQVAGTGSRVYRARVRLLVTDPGTDGGGVYAVSNHYPGTATPWVEGALTWQNAPLIGATPLASVGSVADDAWVEFDVTSRIVGDGTYSFGMRNASTNNVNYSSKEGDDPPQLVIDTRLDGGGTNAVPVAVANSYTVNEDAILGVAAPGLLGNDTDANGDALTAILATAPTRGTVSLAANGSFTYTPNANFNGTDSFTYVADDGRGGTATGTVTITVQPVNDAPVAVDEAYVTDEDVALVRAAPGLLGNDTDIDGDALAAAVAGGPVHGTVVIAANGSFTYLPAADYNGPDSFTYTVSDGKGGTDTGLVTVTIPAVEDAPRPGADAYPVPEDDILGVAAPGVLANDSDPEGDPLAVALASDPAHGTLTWNGDGSFSYIPLPDFNGLDSFTYTLSDTNGGANLGTVTITVTPVNDAPVATGEAYATDEDTPLVLPAPGPLANDTDLDGDVLASSVALGPAHGSLILSADGTLTYAPERDFNGDDSFTYVADDGSGGADTATVNLTVRPVNDPPVAASDAFTTAEEATLVIGSPGVLGNDSDVEGDAVTSAPGSDPGSGSVAVGLVGAFTYTPAPDFNGTDTFTYTALDGRGGVTPGTVTITVTPVNDAPVASGEAWDADEDVPLVVDAPGLLANETDVDADTLATAVVSGPVHGSLALAADGSFTYTSAADYHGGDAFTYRVDDGHGGTATAVATITVRSVNDPPAVTANGYTTREDEPLIVGAPGVLGNDRDVDGDPVTASLATGPQHGTLVLGGDGSFAYTPAGDVNGVDAFTYLASDGRGGATPGMVTITVTPVNDAPVASGESYATDEDTRLVLGAPGVLANEADVDGDLLGAVILSGPAHGTLTLGSDGSFDYAPAPDFNGTDSFTYRVQDGAGGTATGTATLLVRAVNDAPLAVGNGYATNEDVVLAVAAPGVLGNDGDVDGDALAAAVAGGPAHGTLALAGDGSFTYTPAVDFNGADSFSYTASDGQGGTASGTVTISIVAVNDAPVATADAYGTDEDQALAVAAPGIMGNDADVDGGLLRAAPGTGPAHGTLLLDPDGSFTYVPAGDFSGPDSFTYLLQDDAGGIATGTVAITVGSQNDVPVAASDGYHTDEDTPLAVAFPGVLGNDLDVDGDALSAALAAPPAHGSLQLDAAGGFVYTPDPEWSGTDGFSYVVADGVGGTAAGTVSIRVDPVNDAPVAADDAHATLEDEPLAVGPPGVLAGDRDVEGDPLAAGLSAPPANGAVVVAADGGFTYTPGPDFNGTDSFIYEVSDGKGGTANGTVTITVAPVEDAPVAADDAVTVDEDANLLLAVPGVLGNDHDVDGDVLSARALDAPSHGSLALLPDGSLRYVPVPDFCGGDSFTYEVDDARGGTSVATVTVGVVPVNDAPVAGADAWTTAEDGLLVVAAPGLLGNDGDVDGDALAAVLAVPPAHGTVELHPDGSFRYLPAPDYNGADGFTYAADDGHGGNHAATVAISVTPVNDAPVASDDAYSVSEDAVLVVGSPGLLQNDADADGDGIAVRPASPPAHGTLVLDAGGSFVYTPVPDFAGIDRFTYTVEDGNGTQGTGSVTIGVMPVNDAPVAADDVYAVGEDGVLALGSPGVLGNDVDVDVDGLTTTVTRGTSHGTLALQADGGFVYTPVADFFGTDGFEYVADDGRGGSSAGSVVISVLPVNDAPRTAADAYTVEEEGTLRVGAPGVLGNDIDIEGDAPAAALAVGPAHGTVSLDGDGGFTYTPARDFFGIDRFTYRASDGNGGASEGTVAIQVTPVNDAPVAVSDTLLVQAGDVLTLGSPGLVGNDFDADGDNLQVIAGAPPVYGALTLGPGGTLTYTPASGFTGVETFTYRASDGTVESGEATVTIQVEGRGVTFRETARGEASQGTQVATATPIAAVNGDLYLAAISTYPFRTAAAVSGLDLAWRLVSTQCGGRGETGLEIWMARGTPRPGVVTANLTELATEAVIVVSRYSGVDERDPIGGVVSGNAEGPVAGCIGGAASAAYTLGITTLTQGGVVFGAVAMRERQHEPGNGYFERVQTARGTVDATAGLAIVDRAVDAGEQTLSGSLDVDVDWALVGVEIRSNIVSDNERRFASALRAYPNPFHSSIAIECTLHRRARVVMRVYDSQGALVRNLMDAEEPPGRQTMQWDARNDRGVPVASGIYFVRVEMEGRPFVRKIGLVK